MKTLRGKALCVGVGILFYASTAAAQEAAKPFRRGDVNLDGVHDISDSMKGLAANAALQYWRAFAVMPSTEEDEITRFVEPSQTSEPGEEAAAFVQKFDPAIDIMVRGTKLKACEWGLTLEDGPGLCVPNLLDARRLGQLACLRARCRFAKKDSAGAVEDLVAVMVLARHLGASEATLISLLVGCALEQLSSETLASYLTRLDPEQLKELKRRLQVIPALCSLESVVLVEKEGSVGWLSRKVEVWEKRRDLVRDDADLRKCIDDVPELREFWAGLETSPETAKKQLVDTSSLFAELATAAKLPPDEFREKQKALLSRIDHGNAITRAFVPAIGQGYTTHCDTLTRAAMLQAAVTVLLEGPERIKTLRDPVTGGFFEHVKLTMGFELKAAAASDGKAITLRVGE